MMILAVDVQYNQDSAFVAGITFESWSAESPRNEYVCRVDNVADYQPGSFYKRELPCILNLINKELLAPSIIVVDGYVYLDGKQKPGLGKHLHEALDHQTEIVGVAKKPFLGIGEENRIFRGVSKKPLFITTTGTLESAKTNISNMFGANRIPWLLKRVDQLCRYEAHKAKH